MRRAVVSAVGIVSAAGTGRAAFARALREGTSVAGPSERLDVSGFPCPEVCEVRGLDARALARSPKEAKVLARASVLALGALADLVASAPPPWTPEPWDAGFFLGVGIEQGDHRDLLAPLQAARRGNRVSAEALATAGREAMNPLSSLKTLPNMALAHVAMKLGDSAPRGPNAAYSPFDTASLEAVSAAAEAVLGGETELALSGGADSPVSVIGLTTFTRVRGDATPVGEAAALFLVEEAASALRAGRTALAEIEGFGASGDGAAIGEPAARGFTDAAARALASAGARAKDVDAVVLSGLRTSSSAELLGLQEVLGQGLGAASAVAPREVFGQCAAAGGALGVAAAIEAIAAGTSRRVMVLAGSFGGSYGALLLKRPGAPA